MFSLRNKNQTNFMIVFTSNCFLHIKERNETSEIQNGTQNEIVNQNQQRNQ